MTKLIVSLILLFSINLIAQDIISKPKLSIISLDKVKVVYRGIDNPITIAVANAKEYWVSGPGVSKTDELGKYLIRPGSGNELKIIVAIKLQDDSIFTEEYVYKIKGLPIPISTLNSQFSTQGYLEFSIDELKDAEVGIKFIDFIYGNFNPSITQFSIKVPRQPTITINGNIFTEEVLQLLKKARKKDIILISNIKGSYMVGQGLHRPISNLIFQIKK
ncbi:GldM family protein [Flavobacterium gelidilacus]|uniref:GldM family protein n=1 Tax=Flavobacterium gelidilacus TaxID=206041 RepID=UPI000406B927|nr:GldM family protein [Flavobacterium gelidilacus]